MMKPGLAIKKDYAVKMLNYSEWNSYSPLTVKSEFSLKQFKLKI